ncbi:hypothetical protein Trco_002085 [Trichoderma cornu-damae]|uniref:Uncharacterized protein n=1 Tax=Trichoderma cornu-damae TaxID=654480 RepID=A0A9P8TYT3_9HYPO|nr:hypothetical protein Trco_002085 [Trichoderma cornu-damae]
MLRQAVEHFHRQFAVSTPCRRLNSHSGPLESRRRQLGKRNMTGIMSSSSTYLPLWHFDIAWAPGEWKWEPPSTAEERRRKKHAISPSVLFDGLISWLEKSDGDRPFIRPPADVAVSSVSMGETAAIGPVHGCVSTPTDIPRELSKLRDRIALLDTANGEALDRLSGLFQRDILRRTKGTYLSVQGLRLAMEPLNQTARDKISDPRMADRLVTRIRRSLLTGLNVAQKKSPDNALVQDLWMAFAAIVCTSGVSYQNIRLFGRMMVLMPNSVRARIPVDQMFALARAFVDAQASSSNVSTLWASTAAHFGGALSTLDPMQMHNLDMEMNGLFAREERDAETDRKLRFSWLMTKAYNPTTTNDEFVQSYRDLIASPQIDLRHLQLWQIIVGRLKSTGAIDINAHWELTRRREYGSLSQRWEALFSAIHGLANASDVLTEVCSFFKGIDQTGTLISALSSLPISRMSIDSARTIATACDDHRLALHLYEALRSRLGQRAQITTWGWEAWVPYLERIIKDPEITRPVHWEVLNLPRLAAPRGPAGPEQVAREIQAKMALLDKMGQWYMEASHLNDRQVLRRLQRCASVQRALTRGVSSQVLAHVAEVVTRDLQKGEWGRTTWLQWLLGMVAQKHGDKQASDVLKTLKGWRWMVEHHKGPSPKNEP